LDFTILIFFEDIEKVVECAQGSWRGKKEFMERTKGGILGSVAATVGNSESIISLYFEAVMFVALPPNRWQ